MLFLCTREKNITNIKHNDHEKVYIINGIASHRGTIHNGDELRAGKGQSTLPDRQDGLRAEPER